MVRTIDRFKGVYEFLSNFYYCTILYEDIEYPTLEHAFQAAKTLHIKTRQSIAKLATPQLAKSAGRNVLLRPDWEDVKYQIMYDLLVIKFKKNPLRLSLLATEEAFLIEGNWWHDITWGQCTCRDHRNSGENWLGRLLMLVRTELQCRDMLRRAHKRLALLPQITPRKRIT